MAYSGLFVERCPNIKAAGKVKPHEDVGDCFVNVSLEDKMSALGAVDGDATSPPEAVPRFSDSQRRLGLYTRMAAVLRHPLRTTAGVVQDELLETVYQSYWRKPVGKGSDPTPGLPLSHRGGGVVYGKKLPPDPPAAEIVNPLKPPLQVTLESGVGHALYVTTHDAYDPGEQVRRRYEEPAFDARRRYGQRSGVDTSGVYVRKGIRWFNDAAHTPVSNLQAAHTRLRRAALGDAAQPNDVLGTCVPPGHAFGRSTVADHGVLEAMRGHVAPPPARAQQQRVLAHANKLRRVLERRRPGFPFHDLKLAFEALDRGGCGTVPLEDAYAECRRLHVHLDATLMTSLLRDLDVLEGDDRVRYGDFLSVLHHAQQLPGALPKVHDAARPDPGRRGEAGKLPSGTAAFSGMATAGVPSDKKPEHFSLDADSHATAVLSPSIWTQYGLDHRDLFQLRPKEELLRILGAAGVVCPAAVWDLLWEAPGYELASLEDARAVLARKAAARFANK